MSTLLALFSDVCGFCLSNGLVANFANENLCYLPKRFGNFLLNSVSIYANRLLALM